MTLTSIAEEPGLTDSADWCEMVRQLVQGNEAVCRTARKVLEQAEKAGDAPSEDLLTQRLQIQSQDEMGALSGAFNLFLDKLRGTISQVVTAVEGTRDTAQQANYVSGQTRDRLQYQFREIDQVAAAFEEMHATSANIADRAGQAVEAAD